jgi:hypothetical protein
MKQNNTSSHKTKSHAKSHTSTTQTHKSSNHRINKGKLTPKPSSQQKQTDQVTSQTNQTSKTDIILAFCTQISIQPPNYIHQLTFTPQGIFLHKDEKAIYGGEFWGTIDSKKNRFLPSLFFIQTYLKNMRTLIITGKQEWLFTCGRDVFLDKPSNGYYVIKDNNQNILGYGYAKSTLLQNILDIGNYFTT